MSTTAEDIQVTSGSESDTEESSSSSSRGQRKKKLRKGVSSARQTKDSFDFFGSSNARNSSESGSGSDSPPRKRKKEATLTAPPEFSEMNLFGGDDSMSDAGSTSSDISASSSSFSESEQPPPKALRGKAAKRTAGRVGARRTTGEEASSKRVAGSKKKVASTRGDRGGENSELAKLIPGRVKRAVLDPEVARQRAIKLVDDMNQAAKDDLVSIRAGQPGLEKIMMLSKVARVLKIKEMLPYYIDAGVLVALGRWLRVLPNGSLPNVDLRRRIFEILNEMPFSSEDTEDLLGEGLSKSAIVQSGIGKVVHMYATHKDESFRLKKFCAALMEKWTRLSVPELNDRAGGVGSSSAQGSRIRHRPSLSLASATNSKLVRKLTQQGRKSSSSKKKSSRFESVKVTGYL